MLSVGKKISMFVVSALLQSFRYESMITPRYNISILCAVYV
jgi:hypothetical protein